MWTKRNVSSMADLVAAEWDLTGVSSFDYYKNNSLYVAILKGSLDLLHVAETLYVQDIGKTMRSKAT